MLARSRGLPGDRQPSHRTVDSTDACTHHVESACKSALLHERGRHPEHETAHPCKAAAVMKVDSS